MKKYILAVSALCLTSTIWGAISGEHMDLWNRSALIVEANTDWVPGRITSSEILTKPKGDVDEESRAEISISPDFEGLPRARVLSVWANVDGLAEGLRQDINEELPGEIADFASIVPYYSGSTSCLNGVDGREVINGRTCVMFAFSEQVDGHDVEGRVWVDEATAAPLKISYKAIAVPFDLEDVKVLAAKETFHYAYSEGDGSWQLKSETSEIKVKFSYLFLRFIRFMNIEKLYSEHWRIE